MFNSLGRFVAHRRILVLVCSVLVMAILSLAGSAFGNPFGQGGFEDPDSGWATAERLEQEAYGRDALGDVVVSYQTPEGVSVDDPAFQDPIRASLETIRTEFHARDLLFSRRSINNSFVYSPFLPFFSV